MLKITWKKGNYQKNRCIFLIPNYLVTIKIRTMNIEKIEAELRSSRVAGKTVQTQS